ncbi:NHX3, partial [Symbiodinium pilosum]
FFARIKIAGNRNLAEVNCKWCVVLGQPAIEKLPRRWLPPGNVMDLYRHYKITLGEDKVQPVLGTISKKVGELSTFPEPFQFREVRQELEKKMEFIHQFKQHMEDIQRERSLQELLESENLETGGRPILFVQTDGPRLKVQGLWLQSVGLMMFIGDVHLAHDSSMTVEAACAA